MATAEESIYSLLPQQQATVQKSARYRSKHSGRIQPRDFELGVKDIKSASTFGKPDGFNAVSPDEFIRSHSGSFHQTRKGSGHSSPKPRLKDPLPDRHDVPTMGLSSNKNFIVSNALSTIRGTSKDPESEPRTDALYYLEKPDYGKVPDYIVRAKKEQEEAFAAKTAREAIQAAEANRVAPLAEEARQELLGHLKTKWAEVNSIYLKLPFSVDSASKRARKEGLEKELQSIEQDIRLLQRGNILVANEAG